MILSTSVIDTHCHTHTHTPAHTHGHTKGQGKGFLGAFCLTGAFAAFDFLLCTVFVFTTGFVVPNGIVDFYLC